MSIGAVSPYLNPHTHVANQISVIDLRRLIDSRSQHRKAAYTHVLERCYIRIKRCGSVGRLHCVYDVPCMITGMPLYDVQECMGILLKNLKHNGYSVWIDPFVVTRVHICWSDACLEAEKQATRETYIATNHGNTEAKKIQKQKNPQRMKLGINNFKLF
jgi:hypothetical protein